MRKMRVDIVLCSNKPVESVLATIDSFYTQEGLIDLYLHYVVDLAKPDEEHLESALASAFPGLSFSLYTVQSGYVPLQGLSAARNYGIQMARSLQNQTDSEYDSIYLLCVDDDIICSVDCLVMCDTIYKQFTEHEGKEPVLAPTLMYRDTSHVHMIGFTGFSYLLGWPLPVHVLDRRGSLRQRLSGQSTQKHENRYKLQMVGGSFLFFSQSVAESIHFDVSIPYIYEDLDCTMRSTQKGHPVCIAKHIYVNHMEREKTHLEKAFIGSPDQVYWKAKHRVLFVYNHASWYQRILYFLCGMHIHTLRMAVKIIRYRGVGGLSLLGTLFRGTRDGVWKRN